ncbi:MAG: hypothetical protein QOD86_1479 [Miltoncostaeaceae bacterium]|jgi:uncharacterized protein YkwD|nr:hypothetical protein [Miltoncostaeaceae bacterium]
MHGCRTAAAAAAMAMLGALGAFAVPGAAAPAAPESKAPKGAESAAPAKVRVQPGLERALLREMNEARAEYGLPAFQGKSSLQHAARKHSAYLARLGHLDHDSAGGRPFWTRLVKAGYPRNSTMGENLALIGGCGRPNGYVQLRRQAREESNHRQAEQVVAMWLKSPGHRANLLSRDFRYAGTGVTTDGACNATMYTADYGG